MSWFKKPVNIVITVVAGLIAVAAIVLLVWGITHHEEAGLLRVCWVGGEARYEDGTVEGAGSADGSCEGTEELRWPQEQIPLTLAPVSAEGEILAQDSAEVRVLKQAASDLNRQVGFELFRVGSGLDATDADVRFGGAFEGAGAESPPPGYVSHQRVGGPIRGHVHIRSDVAAVDRLLYVVLQHELGHLAGLAHDDFEMSLMFPLSTDDSLVVSPGPGPLVSVQDRMSTAHLTDSDVELLQSLYHQ